MQDTTKKNLLMTLATVGFLLIPMLLLAEWGSRLRYRSSLYAETPEFKLNSIYRKSTDPELVYEMTPGAEEPGKKRGAKVIVNSDGFRDDPFDLSKEKESFRIVVLGDSVAWGYGVDTPDAFPQLLESLLNEEIPDTSPSIEVFNLGVMGYSTTQEVRLLETRGICYTPDLVIVAYVLNDADEIDGGLSRYFDPPSIYLLDSLHRFRRWWAAERIGRTRGGGYPAVIHTLYWPEVMNNLDRFQKVSVEQGVPILFAQVPALDWEGDRYPELELEKRLAGEFEKRGFQVRQLWPAFRGTEVKEFAYDIWHPDETGHRIIAEDLCIYLRGTGLAPRPPEVDEIDSINGKPRRTEP